MNRDKIFAARRAAQSALIIAHHHWAATMLNDSAPEKYHEAAKAFRDLADVLDVYAVEFADRPTTPGTGEGE